MSKNRSAMGGELEWCYAKFFPNSSFGIVQDYRSEIGYFCVHVKRVWCVICVCVAVCIIKAVDSWCQMKLSIKPCAGDTSTRRADCRGYAPHKLIELQFSK